MKNKQKKLNTNQIVQVLVALIGVIGGIIAAYIGLFGSTSNGQIAAVNSFNSSLNMRDNIQTQINNYATNYDSSIENVRDGELVGLKGDQLITKWFELLSQQRWKDACSLFSQDKCDIRDGESVNNHVYEAKFKTVDGYKLTQVYHSDAAPSNVWCVKYTYTEKQSAFFRPITLLMQYTLTARVDGGEDIASRLCEKKWVEDIGERPCTNPSVFYCK